jgi:predicted transglutaminase-like protease
MASVFLDFPHQVKSKNYKLAFEVMVCKLNSYIHLPKCKICKSQYTVYTVTATGTISLTLAGYISIVAVLNNNVSEADCSSLRLSNK